MNLREPSSAHQGLRTLFRWGPGLKFLSEPKAAHLQESRRCPHLRGLSPTSCGLQHMRLKGTLLGRTPAPAGRLLFSWDC